MYFFEQVLLDFLSSLLVALDKDLIFEQEKGISLWIWTSVLDVGDFCYLFFQLVIEETVESHQGFGCIHLPSQCGCTHSWVHHFHGHSKLSFHHRDS